MTNLEANARPSVPLVAGASGNVRFLGETSAFFRLLLRGALLLMVTLGIYRFWLATDIRRFLWSNTEIAGHSLDYTGTPAELLIGFLIAITILIPINALFFFLLFLQTTASLASVLGFLFLAFLGQVAVYRARRYRLTRTVLRGIRFHQTGSSWRYALCASFWWPLALLSFGLLYPWAVANLERYKLRNTFYGDLAGRFEGAGTRLFLRGLLMWLLVMGPFAAGLALSLASIDFDAVGQAMEDGGEAWDRIAEDPGIYVGIALAGAALTWAALTALVLYPVFTAMVLRWWTSGVRFGALSVHSRLRTGPIYSVYLRFLLYAVLFGIGAAIAVSAGAAFFAGVASLGMPQKAIEIGGIGMGLVAYVAVMLGYSTIYQATVKLSLWRLVMESLDLNGVAALERVRAAGDASSAVGEGLADALNVGGL
jgi:uncharacterized membrane protein YjgN (DUF898 family)